MTGGNATVIVVAEGWESPFAFVAIACTVKVPFVGNEITGVAVVAPERIVPPPAFHDQLVGVFVAEAEKATVPPELLDDTKLVMTGIGKLTETLRTATSESLNPLLAVSVISNVPSPGNANAGNCPAAVPPPSWVPSIASGALHTNVVAPVVALASHETPAPRTVHEKFATGGADRTVTGTTKVSLPALLAAASRT